MTQHKKPVDETTGTVTTGHVWDGIRELDTPLPRWWLWIFYATIVWSIGYWVLYPAWPLVSQATPGVLGFSSRQQVEADLAAVATARAALDQQIAMASFDEIRADAALLDHAQRAGGSAFKLACVQCHGTGAEGSQTLGYPNLNDDDWLWGGTPEALYATIAHGIRDTSDGKARNSAMPAYGAMGLLTPAQIDDVAHYVLSLSAGEHDAAAAERGAVVYNTQCFACHGKTGEGNRALGAPNLADAIWLYGGTHGAIAAQIANPRLGMMPAWSGRFDDAGLKSLALYVHSLGGGE
jgi:cytochrome c oxidase cbb3-type subunit 3